MNTPPVHRVCLSTPCRRPWPDGVRSRGLRAWHTRRYITTLIAAANVFDPTALERLRNHARRRQGGRTLRHGCSFQGRFDLSALNRLLAPSETPK